MIYKENRDQTKTVSVIVPIYNTADYLHKCVDSIICQSYQDLEIILVDDGSDDNSPEICDAYALTDKRIKVIHKSNSGIVGARKAGLEQSVGGFIISVDSDDYIEEEMIASMVELSNKYNADIVQCGIEYVLPDGKTYKYDEPLTEGCYDLTDRNSPFYGSFFWDFNNNYRGIRSNICSCFFRRDVIYDVQMAVPEDIVNGEDDACFYSSVLNAKSFYFTEREYYKHNILENSTTRSKSKYSLNQFAAIEKFIRGYLEKSGLTETLSRNYQRYIFDAYNVVMRNVYDVYIGNNYRIPKEKIPYGSRVIVYGAGCVGQSYVSRNMREQYFELVLWVDSKPKGTIEGKIISAPEAIKRCKYDFILVAISNQSIASEIKQELAKSGINKELIIWVKPEIDRNSISVMYE